MADGEIVHVRLTACLCGCSSFYLHLFKEDEPIGTVHLDPITATHLAGQLVDAVDAVTVSKPEGMSCH